MTSVKVRFVIWLCCVFAFSFSLAKSVDDLERNGKHSALKRLSRETGDGSYFDTFLGRKPSTSNAHKENNRMLNGQSESVKVCGEVQALFSAQHGTIIKTRESMKKGAKFISSPHARSNQECIDNCCSESDCTLSVYDGKGKSSCYLFDCSKADSCIFTPHNNYTSTMIQRLPPEPVKPPPVEVQQENELEDLKQLQPEKPPATPAPPRMPKTTRRPTTTTTTTRAPTTTTTTTTVATTKLPTTTEPPRKVNLLEKCYYHSDCLDENAVCDNVCICKPGMKPSYGKCALVEKSNVCSHLQFTCQSRPHDTYTHCIASYDRCDGIAQCPLGDDEVGCQGAEFPLDYTNKAASRQRVMPKKLPQRPPMRRVTTPRPRTDSHEPPKYSSSWVEPKSQTAPGAGQQSFAYSDSDRIPGMADSHMGRKQGQYRGMEEHGGRSDDPHRPPEMYDQYNKDIQDLGRQGWDEEPLSRKRPDVYDAPYSGVTRQGGGGGGGYNRDGLEPYGHKNRYDSGGGGGYDRPPYGRVRDGYRDYYDTRPMDTGGGGGYNRGGDGYSQYRNYQPYGGGGQSLGGPDENTGGRSHVQRRPGVDRRRLTTRAPPRSGTEQQSGPAESHVPQMPPIKQKNEDGNTGSEIHTAPTKNKGVSESSVEPAQKTTQPNEDTPPKHEDQPQPTTRPAPEIKPTSGTAAETRDKPSETRDKPAPSTSGPKTKPQVTLGDANNLVLSKIEIERRRTDSTFLTYNGDLQGAIVALTLGLTVTAVLLVFVVCKLRNVKRRLRRGRLASNDADYLINGMYL